MHHVAQESFGMTFCRIARVLEIAITCKILPMALAASADSN
jgi:hypothetical protein